MRIPHAIRKDPLGWCLILGLALLVVVMSSRSAGAHSWYDPECCSDRDCEPVSNVSFVASDPQSVPVMIVTTSFGTKPVTPQTKIRDSKDNKMHACIYQGHLLCLYLPPSN